MYSISKGNQWVPGFRNSLQVICLTYCMHRAHICKLGRWPPNPKPKPPPTPRPQPTPPPTITTKFVRLMVVLYCWIAHYSDVIMDAIASLITGVSIIYSTVCSGADKKNTLKLRVTGLCEGNSTMAGDFTAWRPDNAENAFIWWRHHDFQWFQTPWRHHSNLVWIWCSH